MLSGRGGKCSPTLLSKRGYTFEKVGIYIDPFMPHSFTLLPTWGHPGPASEGEAGPAELEVRARVSGGGGSIRLLCG